MITIKEQKMKKGQSIIVKPGILDPDWNLFDIGGWQGRIIEVAPDKQKGLFEIAWDSITLKQMPEKFIENSIEEECEYSIMTLAKEDIGLTEPRDSENDVDQMLERLEDESRNKVCNAIERRIEIILPGDDRSVSQNNQYIYFDYLKKNIQMPTMFTGAEDFPWEEKYIFGGWSKKEYEKLKMTQPSYTDKFEFIELFETIDEIRGILAKVKRKPDNKVFMLPLWDLKCTDKNKRNYELISDYSFWMSNY